MALTGGLMREAIDLRFKFASRDCASSEVDQASHVKSLGHCAADLVDEGVRNRDVYA